GAADAGAKGHNDLCAECLLHQEGAVLRITLPRVPPQPLQRLGEAGETHSNAEESQVGTGGTPLAASSVGRHRSQWGGASFGPRPLPSFRRTSISRLVCCWHP